MTPVQIRFIAIYFTIGIVVTMTSVWLVTQEIKKGKIDKNWYIRHRVFVLSFTILLWPLLVWDVWIKPLFRKKET